MQTSQMPQSLYGCTALRPTPDSRLPNSHDQPPSHRPSPNSAQTHPDATGGNQYGQVSLETIETPLATMQAPVLAPEKKLVVVSIMRAGQGILDGILELIPSARVGHIGLYRDPQTLRVIEYFYKVPENLADRDVLVVDPMIATGNTAVAALYPLKQAQTRSLRFLCLLAAPEGIAHFHREHPDVPLYTAAIDEKLDERGYILPGLGDAGDRLFGTK